MLTPEQIADGWKPMTDAPQTGEIIAVCYREWNQPTNPVRYQFAQYCGPRGKFTAPWTTDSVVYADGWMTLAEFAAYRPEPSHD